MPLYRHQARRHDGRPADHRRARSLSHHRQVDLPDGTGVHVGTIDLDVGLQLALLDEGRYRMLTERLRDAGFEMDKNDNGNPTRP